MAIDRALQHDILEKLAEHYPQQFDVQQWTDEEPRLIANMHYLYEHRLITGIESKTIGGDNRFVIAKITASGLDFLANDGGLTAILGVVTIKLHEETILKLIEVRLQAADLPPEEKAGLLTSLRELPGEAIKHLTEKLIDAGLENWPVALLAIQTYLTHAPK
jgi:hypothetical protein